MIVCKDGSTHLNPNLSLAQLKAKQLTWAPQYREANEAYELELEGEEDGKYKYKYKEPGKPEIEIEVEK